MSGGFHKYTYDGPVMLFNTYLCAWKGETVAKSKAAAIRNLVYQCKCTCNKLPGTGGITIDKARVKEVS